jgi:hypothetical protein
VRASPARYQLSVFRAGLPPTPHKSEQLRTIVRQLRQISLQLRHSTDSDPHRSHVSAGGAEGSGGRRDGAFDDTSRALLSGFDIEPPPSVVALAGHAFP